MSMAFGSASCGSYRYLLGVLTCSLLFNLAPVQAAHTNLTSNNTPSATAYIGNATNTIAFASAVQRASSISWQLNQISNIPILPIPTNITAIPEYEIVSKLAPALPAIQAGVIFPDADGMIADLITWTNVSSPGLSLAGRGRRQSALRVMVVGDSMSQGQQGDYTWRYRIWQFFQNNGIDVEMVGPYTGTVPPAPPAAPSPPALYGAPAPSTGPQTSGGYAADVDSAFLSNCNHFAVWGRAVAVDKGLIQGVLESTPADLILFMLGFNDMGWFYSDAPGTIDSVDTFVANARATNPNVKIALANVPQRSFIGGREDLVENTAIYNELLPQYIADWTTEESPIHLVELEENYDCQPDSCPAGYDGLHPNAWGEFQIANAFSQTLVNDFGLGTTPLAVPAQDDSSLIRPLPEPSNFQVFSSPQGVTATWDAVYGAYSYDVSVSINGGGDGYGFSPTSVSSNRWDSQWPLAGWTYAISVRARCGNIQVGPYTSTLSADATPQLADPPQNVNVEPTADGFTVTWDPPTGPNDDSIIEYNIIYWDSYYADCEYISGAAFTSSPAVITGLTPGKNYLIAPVTWNENGQGLPFTANNAVPGAGTPPVPTDLVVISNDPTSVHITWSGSNTAGGYHLWSRNVNQAGSQFVIAGNISGTSCADDYFLFPGVWNYEFCVSAFNGNEESAQGPAVLAPSPASTVTEGSPGPTCPPAPAWCPSGGSVSVPSGGTGTLPPITSTGIQTITTDGVTITITPIQTVTVETLTEPDGSTIILTIPSGSPVITGVETITTDGSTITVGPVPTVTSTMTTVPPGVSVEDFTDFPITTNIWLTTTRSDSSTTIVPVILPCPTCEPVIVWDTPEIPWVEFKWPQLPELPTFHLPCTKIFGIVISGQCPTDSGPPPVNDEDPPDPEPSTVPDSDPEDDPCEFDTSSGMCGNGNYPIFDPNSGTISCDVPSDQVDSQISQCQQNIDNNLDAVQSYLENERSCCSASSKAKRQAYGGMLSSLLHRGLNSLGLGLDKRADYCPNSNENPKQPPADQCFATYTCPHALWPNVCGNAKSAISIRGATSILTHVVGSKLHDTAPWYEGHYFSGTDDDPLVGWKLDQCQVEEYPFGSGNPDRSGDGSSILRLIPGGGFGLHLENQEAGIHLKNWVSSVATRYNNYQKEQTGRNPGISANGIVYCVDFNSSFTRYLPEDLVDQNICASIYGPEFILVNDYWVDGVRTWDPWFDVPGTDRKKPELMYYEDADGDIVVDNPTENDYAVYDVIPPSYCEYPSPGKQTYDFDDASWGLAAGYQAAGRMDNIATEEMCTDPPEADSTFTKREAGAKANQTRTHPRDLTGRQSSSGGFLDANVYIWMGCLANDDGDGEGDDPCADDSNPCGNVATNVPTTNGANPTQDPLPAASYGGYSTGPITSLPSPTFATCSTQNADPDNGIGQGYCVCSGSTFAQSTDSDVTPVNVCAYTTPLPALTTSISTFPTTPTTVATPTPTPSPYVLEIYTREILVASKGGAENTWWWDSVSFDEDTISSADLCDHNANPIIYSKAEGGSEPSGYPISLGSFSLTGHSSCSYQGPNTATVGSIVCDDGLTRTCTAAPTASQTTYIDCDNEDPSNGVARDWWYWRVACEYS